MARGWAVPGYGEVRELGSGVSGTVVLARDEASGHPVAIKYLSDELRDAPGFLEDFRAEAETLAAIDDPHVVRLYEYVQDAAGAAIVMQLVDGVTLRRMLVEQGPTRPESALSVLRGSLLGLGAAHVRGVVHRDYKPENVMVTGEGDSVLTDFGLAAAGGGAVLSAGTPSYLAPELWGDGVASPCGDIYAATAGFVECLTGRPPYGSEDLGMLRRQHERAAIPVESVPEPVRDLVARGLAKDPAGRPADAAAFLAELEAAAVAGYGEGWEERGRRRLAERAALLALLFPLASGAAGGSAVASTVLASPRTKALLGVAAAALLVIGGSIVAATTGGDTQTVMASPAARTPGLAVPGAAPALVPGFPAPSRSVFPVALGRTGVPTSGGGSSSAGDGRRGGNGDGGGGSAFRRDGGSDSGGGGDTRRTGPGGSDGVPVDDDPVVVDPPPPPPVDPDPVDPDPTCNGVLVMNAAGDEVCAPTVPQLGEECPTGSLPLGNLCYLDPDYEPPSGGRQAPLGLAVGSSAVPGPRTPPQDEPQQDEPKQDESPQEERQQEEPQQEEPQQEEPQQEEESDEPDSGGQADDASDQGSEAGESTKADDSSDASESTSAKCEPSECGS